MKKYNIKTDSVEGLGSFVDTRGSIYDIFSKMPMDHACLITSNPNEVRGNHYHKETVQYTFIISGKMEYRTADIGDVPGAYHSVECHPGDFIISDPNEIHAMKAGFDGCTFIAFAAGTRGGVDYEKDTYRINRSLFDPTPIPVAIVFGANGYLGKGVADELEKTHRVIRDTFHYQTSPLDSWQLVSNTIDHYKPSLIVNCTGIFLNNDYGRYTDTFDANYGTNWAIVNHFIDYKNSACKIIMVGSSCYNQPRRDYMNYAASKAALNSLWESASEYFDGTDVSFSIINPPKIKYSPMGSAGGSMGRIDLGELVRFIMGLSIRKQQERLDY